MIVTLLALLTMLAGLIVAKKNSRDRRLELVSVRVCSPRRARRPAARR